MVKDPLQLPDGPLRTLRDAGHYIQELPKATHDRPGRAEVKLRVKAGRHLRRTHF